MEQKKDAVSNGIANEGFDESTCASRTTSSMSIETPIKKNTAGRQQWGNDREFLLSCIAMSVGLGNVWRFPFTAYENGGGAFLIPYIIVLIVIGKPFYLLEMILGQFTSRSGIKIWNMSPAFRGIGIAQFISLIALGSYYCPLMALTLIYLVASFQSELPWAKCQKEWSDYCIDSQPDDNSSRPDTTLTNTTYFSSAELYFYKVVLREKDNIDDGIGMPDWRLTITLLLSWITVFVVVIRGVQSSGKASYFLAIFPYVVLFILLVRAVTLEGSVDGILYFITPNWEKLWTPEVWYHAVAQCFFSLTICFGAVVMFASHNKFDHNVYKDAMIVTTLDTCTSFLAGCTIFGILGHLKHELGVEDISTVVRGGTGLAFISYPETIAKFTVLPQLFGVLFFVMIFVLGIGSEVGLISSVIAIIHDQFPERKYWHVAFGTCACLFFIGLIYVTPGGQFMMTFVDYYVTSFITFLPAALEVIAIAWGYGLRNLLDDVEFMLKRRLSIFWRLCWGIITPAIILIIFIYTVINLQPLKYNNMFYPESAYYTGWVVFFIAIFQIPLWMFISILRKRNHRFPEMITKAFQPSSSWGPQDLETRKRWLEFKEEKRKSANNKTNNTVFSRLIYIIRGK